MRLAAITLHGFKSFADRTVVRVFPGITAIVGPNGCGKSNVADGVRWSLGEQSAKSLRGHRMEDLIFHGSASRKPLGMAEVELVFDNDGTLAVPWSEISVSRRLYRTGESEYLLNNGISRLRDILDLFAGTGANPRAYSVMDQDKLNHVLTAKPHERRVFIEEAAGIARYKAQRNETQGKLEASRQNLQRVRDVMDEVKRQLGSLERQARKAQQYKALQAEQRDLALTRVAAEYVGLAGESERLAGDLRRLGDEEQGLRTRLASLAAREAREREVMQASDHRLTDLRQSLQKVQGELERLLERREQMGVQVRELEAESVRVEDDIGATGERLAEIVGERETARAALREAEDLAAARTATVRELEVSAGRQRATLAADRDRLEALRLEQVRIAAEQTDLMRSAGQLRERHAQLERRGERLAAELAETAREAERLVEHRAGLERMRAGAAAELAALAAERARLGAALAEREAELAAAEAGLGEARVALAGRRSSLESLGELERAREGYAAGVRAVFADGRRAGLEGLVGTVADLLDVPPHLETAIEAVLGERLEWVIVERFEHARAAVRYLRAREAGSATFLPLDHLPREPEAAPDANGVRWAVRSVAAPTGTLLHYLLGRVGIVDHLDEAETLWRKNGVVAIYVTPDGEVLGPTGRLRGGARTAAGVEHSLLTRKRRVRELEGEVARLAEAAEGAHAIVARLEVEVASLRARLPLLDASFQVSEAARLASQKDLEQALREAERVERHRETVATESGQVDLEARETGAVLAVLEQRIGAAQEAGTMHEATRRALRETVERAQARETALVAELTACQVELASAAERVEALGRELGRLDQMETELGERLAQARGRRTELGDRRQWLGDERERTDTAARDVAVERDRVEQEARIAAEHHEGLLAAAQSIAGEMRGLEGELARLIGRIHQVELHATEARVRREELVQEVRRAHGVDEAELGMRHDPARDPAAVHQRLEELEERLAALGPVNLVADEEYRELDERLQFLRAQHDDLVVSIKDLDKALRGMTRAAQERFLQAFQEVNVHFGRLFERLFEGGRAELKLVDPEEGDDPLDTGVELMAQPRGKRLQAVTLLSGGERALTGLALLFAIFYFRPSPFCVLDEVDAPLDDANIHRFLRVLRELTAQTQFLVITHNRKTMEAADALYGVTMEEPGLSKLVSVNLNS